MPGMSRWTLVALALAILLTSGAQADPASVSITGELEVVIADDFEHEESQTFFFVRELASGRTFELRFSQPSGHLKHGQSVTLRGRAVGRIFEVEHVEALDGEGSGGAGDAAVTSAERHAVVLMVAVRVEGKAEGRARRSSRSGSHLTGG